jgi:uncharacterized protein (TIGR02145 family)
MIKILTASFKGITGVTHSIKIYDNDQTGDDLTTMVIAEAPGYVLDSNAKITDVMQGGIIETSCSFAFRNQDGVLADLIEGLSTSPEGRYLVQIERGELPFWRGILLSDFSNREDFPEGGYSFTATDGMALLDNVFVDTQNPPTGEDLTERMIITMIKGLRQIPSVGLWNTGTDNKFLYCKTDWYGQNMNNEQDPLYQAYFKGTALWQKVTEKEGYNGVIAKIIEPLTYKEVLQHILERFNAFLIMQDGAWFIMQRDLAADSPITFFTYRAYPWQPGGGAELVWIGTPYQVEKSVVVGVQPKGVVPDKRWRANGEFSFLPALSKVSVIYGGGNLEDGFDSIIPPGFLPAQTYTTMPLDSGVGNFLHLRIKFKEWFLIDWVGETPPEEFFKAKVRYVVEVKQGNYYLWSDGHWSLTPVTLQINPIVALRHYWDSELQQWVFQDWVEVDFSLISEDLPLDDTEVTLLLTRNNISVSYGGDYYTASIDDHFNYTPDLENHFLLYIVNNENPVTYVTFEAENDVTGFMNEIELTPSLFGTARVIQNSNFSSYSTGGWAITELWGKGYTGDKDKYFNALLVHEMIGNQGKNLLIFSGDVHDREKTLMTPIQCIAFEYEPDIFADVYVFCPNKVSYFAQEEYWSGDWIEVFHLKIMPPAPIPVPVPYVVVPSLPMDIEALPDIIDAGNGGIDTTGGGGDGTGVLPGQVTVPVVRIVQTNSPQIPTTNLISIQPDLNGVLKQTDEFGKTKVIGEDASVFEENPEVTKIYGFLYNYAAISEADIVSDSDWRVPLYDDFDNLITAAGGSLVGGKLKATRTTYWTTPNTGAENLFNFNALAGGSISPSGVFESIITKGIFAANELDGTDVYSLILVYDEAGSLLSSIDTGFGTAIRLCRDASVEEQALADGTYVDDYIGNDGKTYGAVKIDTLIWITENLCETKLVDGTPIPYCADATLWGDITVAVYTVYDNDFANAYTDPKQWVFKDDYKLPDTQISSDYQLITTALTLTSTHSIVESTEGTFKISLPTAVGIKGKKYTIINSGTGTITIDPDGTEQINRLDDFELLQDDAVTIISNGIGWKII